MQRFFKQSFCSIKMGLLVKNNYSEISTVIGKIFADTEREYFRENYYRIFFAAIFFSFTVTRKILCYMVLCETFK
jgi:hypothetical protein